MKTSTFLLALTVAALNFISPAYAESNGTWKCKLDGVEWTNVHGGGSINFEMLTLYSGDDRLDGIYIMMSKPPAVGKFALNDAAAASLTDSKGGQHKSKTGELVISKYTAPQGDVKGAVEGTFTSDFDGHALKECTFSLPVKNL